jgi:hypothetical protein
MPYRRSLFAPPRTVRFAGCESPDTVEHLLQGDVAVEVVAPVSTRAPQTLAFDRPLEPQDDPGARVRVGAERLGQIHMAGDLQSRDLLRVAGLHVPGFAKSCNLRSNICHVPSVSI